MEEKTNVMRILEQKKIAYQPHSYVTTDAVSGTEVAAVLGQDPKRVFKTLVTVAKSGNHYVFVIPVEKELDLKKAAKAVGEKSIDMVKSKGTAGADRLHPRRLFANRHEEIFQDDFSKRGSRL